MIDFYRDEDFLRFVYFVDENKQVIVCELQQFVERFTREKNTPQGIKPAWFIEGCTLYHWIVNKKIKVWTFDSEEEAEHALLLCFLDDCWDQDNVPAYYNSAEEAIAEELADE